MEPIWPLFCANIQMKENLRGMETPPPPPVTANGREMFWEGTKIHPSQVSIEWEWDIPALGGFWAWKRPLFTPGFLGSFSQKV